MTLRLLERLEPRQLLREIVDRAAGLVGVKHGFLYLLEDNGGETDARVPRRASACSTGSTATTCRPAPGSAGRWSGRAGR